MLQAIGVDTQKSEFEISVLLADDTSIQELNRAHRGKDKPTNVLSFPAYEPGEWRHDLCKDHPILLGDLAFSFETIQREAAAKLIVVEDHFTHLCVHGVLHLLGYDHDNDVAADEMERLESGICCTLGLRDPYAMEID